MLKFDKKAKMFEETDAALAEKFAQAGFGLDIGGARLFHPLEAAYLAKIGKSQIDSGTLEKFILSQKKTDALFPFAFAVYSRIRATGRVVRLFAGKEGYFRVYAPGVGREEERPSQLVVLQPGKNPSAKSIADEVKTAHLARLDLMLAIGTEKEIRFYKVSAFNY